ncbi:MAG: hypothetical protein ACMUEM_03165 [Flavobacteriales bacterium AspAUS03]
MHTFTRRINDHYIKIALYLNEINRKDLLHIPPKKSAIIDGIKKGIFLNQYNKLRHKVQHDQSLSEPDSKKL